MKNKKNLICLLGGLVLWLSGFWLVRRSGISWETLRALPYLMIGIGCGLFGYGVGEMVNRRVLDSNPTLAKEQEIAQKDERNVALANRAKAKAYDLMTYMMAALLLTLRPDGRGDGGCRRAGAGLSGNRVLRALLAAAAGKGKLKRGLLLEPSFLLSSNRPEHHIPQLAAILFLLHQRLQPSGLQGLQAGQVARGDGGQNKPGATILLKQVDADRTHPAVHVVAAKIGRGHRNFQLSHLVQLVIPQADVQSQIFLPFGVEATDEVGQPGRFPPGRQPA